MSPPTTLGPVYTAEQVCDLLKIPYSRKDRRRFTTPPAPFRGVTFWDPGFSLREQQELPMVRGRLMIRPDLYARPWASQDLEPGYRQVCLPAGGTDYMYFEWQAEVVKAHREVPCPTAIATVGWVVHFLATGDVLGRGKLMRCPEETAFGWRVALWPLAHEAILCVGGYWDDYRIIGMHLASLRIPGEGTLPLEP